METETPIKGDVAPVTLADVDEAIRNFNDPMWLLRRAYAILKAEREPEVTND